MALDKFKHTLEKIKNAKSEEQKVRLEHELLNNLQVYDFKEKEHTENGFPADFEHCDDGEEEGPAGEGGLDEALFSALSQCKFSPSSRACG